MNRSASRTPTPAPTQKDDTLQILKRLISYMTAGEARPQFVLAILLRLAGTIGLVALPFVTGQAIDVVSDTNGSMSQLQPWVVRGFVAGVVFLVLSVASDRIFARLATTALYRLQTDLFDHIQTMSLNFFDRQPLGDLMSRVTNDAEMVSLFYEGAVGPVFRDGIQILMTAIVVFFIDWKLAMVAIVIVPLMLFAVSVVQRIAIPAFTQLQEQLGDLSGFQEETLSGHKVIISNRRQEWADEQSVQLANGVFEVGSQANFVALIQFPLTQFLTIFDMVFVLVIGSFYVMAGGISLGVVIAFATYAALLAKPLSTIANLTGNILNAVAGGRRVFAIMDEEPAIQDTPDARPFEFKGGHVEFDNVDFSYVPGRQILRHNTFEAQPGQMIGICGPTGAGKSTIINILTRYYDTDSGNITIDGQNLRQLTQDSLRKQIGTVLQEAFLFSDTVMNNLKYAREDATEEECIQAAKEANAHEFITHLPHGYDTMLAERGSNLSQGQRQMLTIARAMVAKPKLLILDEATSNVDTRTEKMIQEGLQRLMHGKTSFVIAHRLSTIRPADKILVVNGGEIVEQGSHDQLMARKGFYYALYMSQFKGKAPAGTGAADVDFVST